MPVRTLRMLVGVALFSTLVSGVQAAPPLVNSSTLPSRNFPSEKELQQFLEPPAPFEVPDPPPHEGAMIGMPYLIEPPDLLIVELLEGLPGRPISGERLVRPDGSISLGFYGDVHVRGLTVEQAKVKVLLHLRKYLTDEMLGLYRYNELFPEVVDPPIEDDPAMPRPGMPAPPPDLNDPPPGEAFPPLQESTPSLREQLRPRRGRPPAGPQSARPAARVRLRRVADGPFPPRGWPKQLTAPRGEKEQNRMGENLENPNSGAAAQAPGSSRPLDARPPAGANVQAIHPADSDRIFVDVTAYNSKVYFVEGDVATPGRMPHTGNETVLDALNYCGGMLPTAEPKDIRLVRPAAGGKPARVYRLDLDAFLKKGDPKANYQIFPGDRLVVGRNAVEQATIELDRVARQVRSVQDSMLMSSLVARSLTPGGTNPFSPGSPISVRVKLGSLTWTFDAGNGAAVLTPAQREAVMKEWVDFWWKAASRAGSPGLDERTFREALMRPIAPPAAPAKENEKD